METNTHSLPEVNQSIETRGKATLWRKILAFFGPAYLVSVGYMDPGNWATDIAGGSSYGYSLIWVLLMSNLMALLLQSLSARLGIVRGLDLAQANRFTFPKKVNYCLWFLAELAIAATDLAEVLGMAIGLQLLFNIPILWGVVITLLDTFLILILWKHGVRWMEAFIISMVAIIAGSFFIQIFHAQPDVSLIAKGLFPSLPDSSALYIAIGIIGATVMPHNLYLHSALVQTRKIDRSPTGIRQALKYAFADSAIALNLAFFVNASILILAGAAFYYQGKRDVQDLHVAHELLAPLLGFKLAPILFAIALIASGQSSTITGTLSGQIVMEGYLRLRISPWLRRLITRLAAIIPAIIVILLFGQNMVGKLLVFSQVCLSLQLGFAIVPLIHFVSEKRYMGSFVASRKIQISAWIATIILVGLNIRMLFGLFQDYLTSGNAQTWLTTLIIILFILAILLLAYITIFPFTTYYKNKVSSEKVHDPTIDIVHTPLIVHDLKTDLQIRPIQPYKNIAVTLDFSNLDSLVINHALAQGSTDSTYLLIHIVESPGSKLLKSNANDLETRTDSEQLQIYQKLLIDKGFRSIIRIGYAKRKSEIIQIIKENDCDLLVMGAHQHKGIMDYVFGETINAVRHKLQIPVLIVTDK